MPIILLILYVVFLVLGTAVADTAFGDFGVLIFTIMMLTFVLGVIVPRLHK